MWQLTYHQPSAEAMGPTGIVQGLVELVRSAAKEKVLPPALCSHSLCLCGQLEPICSGTRIAMYNQSPAHHLLNTCPRTTALAINCIFLCMCRPAFQASRKHWLAS